MDRSLTLLLVASAMHLGFQLTVTAVVYPALASSRAADWSATHAAHTRRIGPVVLFVYAPLAVVCGWVALQVAGVLGGGSGLSLTSIAAVVALLGAAGAAASTGFGAARTHGRLAGGRQERLVRRLLVEDRVRLGFAILGALGALVAWIDVASLAR